jgi:hypothetical protein
MNLNFRDICGVVCVVICGVVCVVTSLIFSAHQAQAQSVSTRIQEPLRVSIPSAAATIEVLATFESADAVNGTFSFLNQQGEILTLPLPDVGRQQVLSIKKEDQFWLIYHNSESLSEIRVERLQHQYQFSPINLGSTMDQLLRTLGVISPAVAQQQLCSCRGGTPSTLVGGCSQTGGQCSGACPQGGHCEEVPVGPGGISGRICGCQR